MKKLDYGRVFVLGFGFLGISLLWAVYNAYVPLFLQAGSEKFDATTTVTFGGFGLSAVVTGFIMSLDNIAAVFIQPWIGMKSDRTRTRWGRRMPYIMVGAPLSVAGFIAIPYMVKLVPVELSGQLSQLKVPFALLILALGLTLLAAAIYRTPAIALMPDIVPSKFRSQANGIINLMGGIGVVIGLFAGGMLFDIDIAMPFIVGGAVVLISSAIVVFAIKEPEAPPEDTSEKQNRLLDNLREVWHDDDRSVLFLLL
ncbi:MAG TPA: MFS transporter, partial [Anaerolineae bacterium]|nr:MFS transporter [Anaerolineae bacterium]